MCEDSIHSTDHPYSYSPSMRSRNNKNTARLTRREALDLQRFTGLHFVEENSTMARRTLFCLEHYPGSVLYMAYTLASN
jgi:hypothetical protein